MAHWHPHSLLPAALFTLTRQRRCGWLIGVELALGLTTVQAGEWCQRPVAEATPSLAPILHQLQAQTSRPPAPLASLHTEGTLPHQGIYDQSMQARQDLVLMRNAALVWRAIADPRWLQLARRYLLSWIDTYQPSLNPIDETGFDALIDTYAIIKPALAPAEQLRASNYLQAWAARYISAMQHPGKRGIWSNNWQSHRVKLVTMMAVALDDRALFEAARALFQQQLDANLLADGEVLDFRQRDALHYVVYDLQPLLQAALAARSRGQDWYHWRNRLGSSLASAVGWLQPYVSGLRSHQEFVHSLVPFDAVRAAAGIAGFSGPFEPKRAASVYWLATSWDPSLQPLAQQLQSQPPPFIALCGQ